MLRKKWKINLINLRIIKVKALRKENLRIKTFRGYLF